MLIFYNQSTQNAKNILNAYLTGPFDVTCKYNTNAKGEYIDVSPDEFCILILGKHKNFLQWHFSPHPSDKGGFDLVCEHPEHNITYYLSKPKCAFQLLSTRPKQNKTKTKTNSNKQ